MHVILKETELRVGYVFSQDFTSNTLRDLASKLVEVDQIRLKGFLRFEDKLAFALGRRLVQRMLSECGPEPSRGWLIEVGASGKPRLLRAEDVPDVRFNITHCSGLVAVVVALGREVGIDAESVNDVIDHVQLARTHLPTVEVNFLEGVNGVHRRDAFFGLWTLREAYVKATGQGIVTPLSQVHFSLHPLAVFSASSDEALDEWFLWQRKITLSHVVAVAAQRDPSEKLTCQQRLFHLQDLRV